MNKNKELKSNPVEKLDYEIAPPASESLLLQDKGKTLWPEDIQNNNEIQRQSKMRNELSSTLNSFYNMVPKADMDITEAIEKNKLDSETVVKMYDQISNFIEDESFNKKIILYLPFELITQKKLSTESSEINNSIERFSDVYMKKWKELLSIKNYRTSFVNGDIVEQEYRTGNIPEVSKAAHLIPILAQKGQLSVQQVLELIKNSDDQILRDSIADTMPVLADMNILTDADIEKMQNSEDRFIKNIAVIIKDNKENKLSEEKKNKDNTYNAEWLDNVDQEIQKDLSKFKNSTNASTKRVSWENQENEKNIVKKFGKDISNSIESGSISHEALQKFLNKNQDTVSQKIYIESVKNILKYKNNKDTINQYSDSIKNLWDTNNPETQDYIEGMYLKLYSSNLLEKKDLDILDIQIPNIGEPFSKEKINSEMVEISAIAKSIENDPELSKFVYPTAILYGSKIKGYGSRTSDIDIAVFIKPGTSLDTRDKIQNLLQEKFKHKKIQDKPMEFWLTEDEDNLAVKDITNPDNSMGDSTLAHVLFEGAWCGDRGTIKELHEKLLTKYLYSKNDKERNLWLSELERDTLQYRLMHKGYNRMYSKVGGVNTEHSDDIDGESTFWDSGYRRLATKLFIQKVFLPNLEK